MVGRDTVVRGGDSMLLHWALVPSCAVISSYGKIDKLEMSGTLCTGPLGLHIRVFCICYHIQ